MKPLTSQVRAQAKRLLVSWREWRDASAFPIRRRRALARLRALGSVRRVVVLCHGNICRSPYLEVALRRAFPALEVSSAGFVGPGRPAPEHALSVARSRGLDLSAHQSRIITRDVARGADLIIVMDVRQGQSAQEAFGVRPSRILVAGDLSLQRGELRSIRDPWRHPIEVFASSYDRLDRCVAILRDTLQVPAKP